MPSRLPLLLLTMCLAAAGCTGTPAPRQQPVPTGRLAAELAARVADAASVDGSTADMRMACTARAFGRDPATAVTVDQIKTAYAWIWCQQIGGDSGMMSPVAVTFGRPPRVQVLEDGHTPEDFDRIFPPDVRTLAGAEDPTKLGNVRPPDPI